jgi:hypothetical protein
LASGCAFSAAKASAAHTVGTSKISAEVLKVTERNVMVRLRRRDRATGSSKALALVGLVSAI